MDTRGTSAWRWSAGLAAASLLVCGAPVAEQLAVMAAETAPERLPDDVVKPAGGYRQYNKSDSSDCPSCFAREQAVKKRLELQKQGLLQPSKPPSTFTGKISSMLSQPRDASDRATGPIPKTEMAGSDWTGINSSGLTNNDGSNNDAPSNEPSAGQSRVGKGPVAPRSETLEVEFQPNRTAAIRSSVQPVAAPDSLVAQARPRLAPVSAGTARAQGAPQPGQYQQPARQPQQQPQLQQQQFQQPQQQQQYSAQQFGGEQFVQETDPAALMMSNEPPPTAIERELEKLFGKDGREAPPMRFSQMEAASGDDEAAEANFRAAAPQPMQSFPTAGQNAAQSAEETQQPAPKKSFFKRLIPSFLRREEKSTQPAPQAAKTRPASQQPWKPGQPVPGGQPLATQPRFNQPQQLPAGVAVGSPTGNMPQNLSPQSLNSQGAPQSISNQPHPLHVQQPHPIADMAQPAERLDQQPPAQQQPVQQQPVQRIPELTDAEPAPAPAGKASRNPGSEEDGFRLDDEQAVDQQRPEKLDPDLLIDDVLPGTAGAKSTAKSQANKLKPKTPPVAANSKPPVADQSTSTKEQPAGKSVADAAQKPVSKPTSEKFADKPAVTATEKAAQSASPEKLGDAVAKPKADSPYTGLLLDLAEAEKRIATDSRKIIVDDEDLQLPAAAPKVAAVEKSIENGTAVTTAEKQLDSMSKDPSRDLSKDVVAKEVAAAESVSKDSVSNDSASKIDAPANPEAPASTTNAKPQLVEIPQSVATVESTERNDSVAHNSGDKNALPTTGTNSASEKNERDPAVMQARIAARGDLKGFKGFCPVTLRNERRLVDAKPEFRGEYGGRSYYVSSAEALDQFNQNPEKYVPAFDGRDVVQQASGAVVVEGSLDHAAWFKGRLYLFATADARIEFVNAPAEFVKKSPETSSSDTLQPSEKLTGEKPTETARPAGVNNTESTKTSDAALSSPEVTAQPTKSEPPSLDDEAVTHEPRGISSPKSLDADDESNTKNAPAQKVKTVPSLDDGEPSTDDDSTTSARPSEVSQPALVVPGAETSSNTLSAPKTGGFRPLAAPTTTTIGTPVSKANGTSIPPMATAPVATPGTAAVASPVSAPVASPGTAAIASPTARGLPQKGTVIARPAIRPAPRNPNVVPPAKIVEGQTKTNGSSKDSSADKELDDEDDDLDLE